MGRHETDCHQQRQRYHPQQEHNSKLGRLETNGVQPGSAESQAPDDDERDYPTGRDDGPPEAQEIGMIILAKERANKGQRSYVANEDRVNHRSRKREPEPTGFSRKTFHHKMYCARCWATALRTAFGFDRVYFSSAAWFDNTPVAGILDETQLARDAP
jgi:hypothetical protein